MEKRELKPSNIRINKNKFKKVMLGASILTLAAGFGMGYYSKTLVDDYKYDKRVEETYREDKLELTDYDLINYNIIDENRSDYSDFALVIVYEKNTKELARQIKNSFPEEANVILCDNFFGPPDLNYFKYKDYLNDREKPAAVINLADSKGNSYKAVNLISESLYAEGSGLLLASITNQMKEDYDLKRSDIDDRSEAYITEEYFENEAVRKIKSHPELVGRSHFEAGMRLIDDNMLYDAPRLSIVVDASYLKEKGLNDSVAKSIHEGMVTYNYLFKEYKDTDFVRYNYEENTVEVDREKMPEPLKQKLNVISKNDPLLYNPIFKEVIENNRALETVYKNDKISTAGIQNTGGRSK